MTFMKKIAGTSWDADYSKQKKLYVGCMGPVLEYRISFWGTAAKSNLEKATRVQNQASRVVTGALRSTPIQAMDTLAGLQTLESRWDRICQIKGLKYHSMHSRMSEPTKCRLK